MTTPTTDQSSRELFPCPFCGCTNIAICGTPERGYYAVCEACAVATSEVDAGTQAGAEMRWNRRPALSGQTAEIGWNAGNTAAPGDFSEEIAALPAQAMGEKTTLHKALKALDLAERYVALLNAPWAKDVQREDLAEVRAILAAAAPQKGDAS